MDRILAAVARLNLDPSVARRTEIMGKMRQYHDNLGSEAHCPCGATVAWCDRTEDRVRDWVNAHDHVLDEIGS